MQSVNVCSDHTLTETKFDSSIIVAILFSRIEMKRDVNNFSSVKLVKLSEW